MTKITSFTTTGYIYRKYNYIYNKQNIFKYRTLCTICICWSNGEDNNNRKN